MEVTDHNQVQWTRKYYVVEAKTFYQGDTFTAQSVWTTKDEAIAEKNRTMNLNPDNLRDGLRTRYRHRTLSGMDARRLLH